MPLYAGTAEMAIKTGAEIVPMAIERYGERYMVAIGKNLSAEGLNIEDKYQLTNQLRDALADLKWLIWENEGVYEREDLTENYSEWFLNDVMHCEAATYTLEDVLATRFRTKEMKELEELDLEIIMEANQDDTVSGNDISEENTETIVQEEQQEITDANGGDITSSTFEEEGVGSTAPLTGVLLDKETGEALNKEEDDSPY